MIATALLLLCLLSCYVYRQHKARSRSLRDMKAKADAKLEEAYVNHDVWHTIKWLREYTAYPL